MVFRSVQIGLPWSESTRANLKTDSRSVVEQIWLGLTGSARNAPVPRDGSAGRR